ncbi:MAG: hypothetical protein QM733_23655 [Ilumatobacteraceae bacterium]
MNIRFTDADLRRRCNSAAATEKTWGPAASDVRTSLCVLAVCPTATAYKRHPHVTSEGDKTVYKGRVADVILDLTEDPGPPPEVVVEAIDIRAQRYTP